jgi:hypothetical protein
MTKQNQEDEDAADRPAIEVGITPEMIEAGALAMLNQRPDVNISFSGLCDELGTAFCVALRVGGFHVNMHKAQPQRHG